MREQVLTRLGSAGDKDTQTEAFKRFEDHCKGIKVLSGDIRTPVSFTKDDVVYATHLKTLNVSS